MLHTLTHVHSLVGRGLGRAVRVALGSAAASGLVVYGLWLTFGVRQTTGVTPARDDLVAVGVRCGGLAVIAAAQVLARSAVLGALYPLRRGDWAFEMAAWAVLIVSGVGAVVFGLSGR
jgi:hypothetical protein